MTKTILILAIAAAFVAGASMTSLMSSNADAAKPDPIIAALDSIANAIRGINPTVNVNPTPVNVDPTPITVNVGSESTKNVIRIHTQTGFVITCLDNNQIIDGGEKVFSVDEFGDNIPSQLNILVNGLFLSMYKAETDGQTFEITGVGSIGRSADAPCPEFRIAGGSNFGFTMTGQCTAGTQVTVVTTRGASITMNADVACV